MELGICYQISEQAKGESRRDRMGSGLKSGVRPGLIEKWAKIQRAMEQSQVVIQGRNILEGKVSE